MNIIKTKFVSTVSNTSNLNSYTVYEEGYINLDNIQRVRTQGSYMRIFFIKDYEDITLEEWSRIYNTYIASNKASTGGR